MDSIKVIGPSTELGEGPHWDYERGVLYYVDINDGRVYKYNPVTDELTSVKVGAHVSFVIPVEGKKDEFVIGTDLNIALLMWDGKSPHPNNVEFIVPVDTDGEKPELNQLNDGKADPSGVLWAGTLSRGTDPNNRWLKLGSLYSFNNDSPPIVHVTDVSLSNGMAWSKDAKKFYYIDSATEKIDSFDFNVEKGTISNRQTVFDFKATGTKGLPDGMTIDSEDKLWVACFGASKVIRVDPAKGTVISHVDIPASQVTSVTFGGPNLDELYVTTATIFLSDDEKKNNPLNGKTFRITGLGVKGTRNQYVKY